MEGPPDSAADEPAKLSDQIYASLFQEIAAGRYALGARLPAETALVARFGASRPIVREALAQLRADGLVVSHKGSGSYVARRPERAVLEFAPVANLADLARCLEFRVSLEGEAAFMAAQRRSPEALAALEERNAELEASIRRGSPTSEPDFAFHLAVAEAAGNALYGATLRLLRDQVLFGMDLARRLSERRSGERDAVVPKEHSAILTAIRARRPDAARAAMRAHVEFARTRILGELAVPEQSPNAPGEADP